MNVLCRINPGAASSSELLSDLNNFTSKIQLEISKSNNSAMKETESSSDVVTLNSKQPPLPDKIIEPLTWYPFLNYAYKLQIDR